MRWLLMMWMVLVCGAARCEDTRPTSDIAEVLRVSQQKQLDAMTPADATSPRALKVRESFEKLLRGLSGPALSKVELRVVRGDIVGETLQGRIVVANVALADLPEGERIFILAHELGHVVLDHWSQMGLTYAKWVPGPVEQQHTDAIADRLGRDASALAYRQEFEADAFALSTLRALDLPDRHVVAAFMNRGWRNDTATHPGTRKRLSALRNLAPDWLSVQP
ncbi:M48 family metalloprotease [Variovorax sp. J22P240]|uniref:M48 family metalloprotease n=1 Tax=Variovorax sp. J22P240 TaxID=3053514 RepID=UPI002577F88B|nr:M48 family metalloprotease [Variovorax sp. J22P240]MDM0001178.1 M48 family metalloprotease [Variovorax sp. J22P240]